MSNENEKTTDLPVLPIRDLVVFPEMVVPLFVGREKSVRALEEAMQNNNGRIIITTQKDGRNDEPVADDLYETGTVCNLLQLLPLPDGTVKALIEAESRVYINNFEDGEYLRAQAELIPSDEPEDNADLETLQAMVRNEFEQFIQMSGQVPEILAHLDEVEGVSAMADTIAGYLPLPVEQKQEMLEITNPEELLERIIGAIEEAKSVQEAEHNIRERVEQSMQKTQRDYYLNEQMKAIQEELGEDSASEMEELENRIREKAFPEKVRDRADKELKKLKGIPAQSPEATVLRNYLDALLDFPFGERSDVDYDLKKARAVLDDDHYGLDKVKDQVIENLAVQGRLEEKGLSEDAEADVLCLVGPPGVGKTSVCKSLAKATGRECVRMAVGGVRDEAEIRGHRRTYIGSKPGKIYQKMVEAGTMNPLFVIDEIDKLSSDSHQGDPSAAMLEVLDPEQNDTFEDHYLEVPVDLSKVKFVCTANSWENIPGPLQDRMETIFLGSYTEDEKLEIAKQHLVRKQRKAHGLDEDEFSINDEALRDLIRYYTKESGVRNLQREIKKLCRKAVVELNGQVDKVEITADNLGDDKYAGKRQFKYDLVEDDHEIGMVTGLAYTSVGGETLPIEATKWPESPGKVIYTGSLGDVMKESIQVAEGWLKAKAGSGALVDLSIEDVLNTTYRVHVPEGAIPKDGPSAGAGMLTAIFSAATERPVRKDIAMTGELSLRGKVTAIGGLREKLSAAARGGYSTVLIPEDNVKDLDDVPQQVKDALDIKSVATIEEVLKHALVDGENIFKPAESAPRPPAGQQQPGHSGPGVAM